MRHVMRKGDKVWRQFNGTQGDNGVIRRIIYDDGDKEVVVDFYDKGTKVFDRTATEDWTWTDSYGGTYIISKGRTL